MVVLPAWPPGVADVLAERLSCCVAKDHLLVECGGVEPAGVQVAFDGLGFGFVGVDAGGALRAALAVADLPAGSPVAGGGWDVDEPGHGVSSRGGGGVGTHQQPVPEEFRKIPGRVADESTVSVLCLSAGGGEHRL